MTTTLTRTPPRRVTQRTNYARNSRFGSSAIGTKDWSVQPGTAGAAAMSRVAAGGPSAATPTFGRATWTAASTAPPTLTYSPAKGTRMPAPDDGLYAAAGVQFRSSSAGSFYLVIRWYDVNGNVLTSNGGAAVAFTANTWKRITAYFIKPAGAFEWDVYVATTSLSVPNGTTWDVSQLLCEVNVAAVGVYFDGSMDASQYYWQGTADDSASIAYVPNPADVFTALMLLSFPLSRRSGNIITDVPGGEPEVTYAPALRRAARLQLLLADRTAAVAFDAFMSQAAGYTLNDPDWGIAGLVFALDESGYDVELDAKTLTRYVATVNYREVAP